MRRSYNHHIDYRPVWGSLRLAPIIITWYFVNVPTKLWLFQFYHKTNNFTIQAGIEHTWETGVNRSVMTVGWYREYQIHITIKIVDITGQKTIRHITNTITDKHIMNIYLIIHFMISVKMWYISAFWQKEIPVCLSDVSLLWNFSQRHMRGLGIYRWYISESLSLIKTYQWSINNI